MTQPILQDTQANGVATLWLNRPEVKNALDMELIGSLSEHLDELAKDSDVRMVVLRGKGSHFCAGADLNWMQKSLGQSRDENMADARQLAELLTRLDSFPTPTFAYIQGGAYGGALGLAACCDIVVADPEAVFALSELKLGLVPAMISPFLLRRMGERFMRRYAVTAEAFNGELAKQMGLVNELATPEQADRWVEYFADHFSAAGPEALRATKELILKLRNVPPTDVSQVTTECIADIRQSEEAQAGMQAFFNKLAPPWRSGDV